jgi:hypothetical protein
VNNLYHGFVRAPDGTITTFEAPNAGSGYQTGTLAYSINASGTIAGLYYDSNQVTHGFVRTAAGDVTAMDAPGAGAISSGHIEGTEADSVDDEGVIVGAYIDSNNAYHGFERSPSGTINSKIGAPGSGTGEDQGTYSSCINDRLVITGSYIDSNNVGHGFLLTP